MPDRSGPAHPGVRFPPPLLFVAGFLLAWLVESRVAHLPIAADGASGAARMVGTAIVFVGVALGVWGALTFVRARTAIIPNQPASRVVVSGPYRFTRNPMYIGLTATYVGLAVFTNTIWPLLLLPAVLFLVYQLVIRREERYLAAAFGAEYDAYRQRVRRWL